MGAPAVITRVFAQLQELLDVEVPRLQVSAHRALALAALIDRHSRVIDDLQKRYDTLRLAVRSFDMRAQCPHACPVVAQAACELGQQRIFLDGFVDAV